MAAQIMFFTLGFLIAMLIALCTLPALNARAHRLAKRRVEALLPVSLEEIAAGRDLIRAEGAVAENRKDRIIAQKDEALHKQMLELSRNRREIETLQAANAALRQKLEESRAPGAEQKAESPDSVAIAAQNAALSRRIEELADLLMAQGQNYPSPKNSSQRNKRPSSSRRSATASPRKTP